jgi:hypothetical protein
MIGVAILIVLFFNIQLSSNVTSIHDDSNARLPSPTTKGGTINKKTRHFPIFASQNLPSLVPAPKQIQRDAPFHLRQKTPIFVVGLPKVGTTSIHHMFQCNGLKSSHYCCCGSNRTHTHCNDGGRLFSECMRKNMKQKIPILQGCGTYDVSISCFALFPARYEVHPSFLKFLLSYRFMHRWMARWAKVSNQILSLQFWSMTEE